jgi:hypothetical protein
MTPTVLSPPGWRNAVSCQHSSLCGLHLQQGLMQEHQHRVLTGRWGRPDTIHPMLHGCTTSMLVLYNIIRITAQPCQESQCSSHLIGCVSVCLASACYGVVSEPWLSVVGLCAERRDQHLTHPVVAVSCAPPGAL